MASKRVASSTGGTYLSVQGSLSGGREVRQLLEALGDVAFIEVGRALYAHGEDVMALSQERFVPVMDSGLKNSGFVHPPTIVDNAITVQIGYSAPYAARIHENPRAGRTGGYSPSGRRYKKWAKVGQWKYLEVPLRSMHPQLLRGLADTFRAAIARRRGA